MTEQQRPQLPKLPAGAGGILPTVWVTFVVTVLLALAFSFANVWELSRTLGIERHVAPLIGPAVDLTAVGLLVVVPWLVLAGVPTRRLGPANKLMAAAGFLTLALNSAPSAIKGWTAGDAKAWGRAAVEAIVPFLLMMWSHVGPKLVALFVEVRERHAERVAEILRVAEESSTEAAERRCAEINAAVAEALRGASVEWETKLAEEASRRTRLEADIASAEERHRTSMESSTSKLAQAEAEIARLREASRNRTSKVPRRPIAKAADDSAKPVRKSAAELLEERVEAAKEALPTWQLETPSGPEIGSALGLKSDGVISAIRKRLEADRLELSPAEES